MQTTESPICATNVTATATVADGVASVPTDRLKVTHSFVTRGGKPHRPQSVEEDSTDIYLLERCSPLNDF